MDPKSPWGAGGSTNEGGVRGGHHSIDNLNHRHPYSNRGSLGQVIERSTSAPPPSSDISFGPARNALVGPDLLDDVVHGYDNMSLNLHSPGRSSTGRTSEDGLSTFIGSQHNARSNRSSSYLSSDRSAPGASNDAHSLGLSAVGTRTEGLIRSQSETPYDSRHSLSVGGALPNEASRLTPLTGFSVRRPASTGVISRGVGDEDSMLRPTTRTLMDLIGEDSAEALEPGFHSSQRSSTERYHPESNWSGQALSSEDRFQRHGEDTVSDGADYHRSHGGVRSSGHTTSRMPSHAITHHSSQIQGGARVVSSSASYQQPQSMYYSKQHEQIDHPSTLQAQLLPGGQTLYLNTNATPLQTAPLSLTQQQPIVYQGQQAILQPQQQVIQRDSAGRQFVSVVPMQNNAQQLSYWPQEGGRGLTGLPPIHSVSASVPVESDHSPPYSRNSRDRGRGGGRRGPRRTADSRSTHSSSSPLLDDFRSSKTRDWTAFQIEGHIVEFCQDQNGSRFIQQRLEMGDVAEQQVVMREVLPVIRRLRNDVFGNYVVQKLLDFGTPAMKADIRDTLEGEMLQLSLQMYGCRVVQKALESLSEEDLPVLLSEFNHNVLSCIHDQNGNHVIQKCIEVISSRAKKAESVGDRSRAERLTRQMGFIVNDVLVNTTALSCHPYGCRVLQRILEHCQQRKKEEVLDEISKCHRKLLDDQYGNYVIQHVLQFGRQSDRDSLLGIIVENGLLTLSRQKFASNVVEKLLKYGNSPQRRAIVREMLKKNMESSPMNGPAGVHSVVLLMVRDAYANYVVQTTLDVVPESDEKRLLLDELNAHSEELRNYTFAKHIVTKLAALNSS